MACSRRYASQGAAHVANLVADQAGVLSSCVNSVNSNMPAMAGSRHNVMRNRLGEATNGYSRSRAMVTVCGPRRLFWVLRRVVLGTASMWVCLQNGRRRRVAYKVARRFSG